MKRDLKIFTNNIDEQARKQIDALLNQEAFKNSKIRIMPDVHTGKGCVIGFTGNLGEKVIPGIVGIDIGCGMLSIELGNIKIDFNMLDNIIRTYIPSGRKIHAEDKYEFAKIKDLYCYDDLKKKEKFNRSIGTLGGGNHFIEIDSDNDGNKYLIIHSGSRNLGMQVADYYQQLAITKCNLNEHIEDDFCYLEGIDRDNYLHDMKICQEFASLNRHTMANEILIHMNINKISEFETIHNYISFEDNIVRKGAISARKGEKVLIPMNMRDGCIVAIGKGNSDWNYSAPHGSGRIMSRKEARENLNINEYKEEMKNIYTTSVNENTIDESPMAYKPMDEIINNIKDTVEVINIIKPLYNFKADE